MGYDVNRFKSKVYNEVVCCICFGILESPYEIVECGHLFCENCIKRWLMTPMYGSSTCPIDRNEVCLNGIRPAPEFITNFIGQLMVECDFAEQGCIVQVPLAKLNRHRHQCPLNPKKPIACSRGCGVWLPPSQMLYHHCDLDLCEDAILWNDIFEKAKIVIRRRSYDRYQKKHSYVSIGSKKLLTLFTRWLSDPRFKFQDQNSAFAS